MIADGSAAGDLEGLSYNRSIRFQKLKFEALNLLAWNGFQRWIVEHHDKKPRVNELMKGLKQLIDSTCEPELKEVTRSPLFEEVSQLILPYSNHLRHGKYVSSYHLRRKMTFKLPRPRTDMIKKSCSYNSIIRWNALENQMKSISEIDAFKKSLKSTFKPHIL